MKKSHLSLVLVVILVTVLITGVSASSTVVKVLLDGHLMTFPDQQPIILNGRTLVPIRFVAEKLGATVEWVEATNTVQAIQGNSIIELPIGKTTIRVNGVSKAIDVPAQILGGRTMVPLRVVSENFGATVEWDQANMTVIITASPRSSAEILFDPSIHTNPDGSIKQEKAIEFAKRALDNLMFYKGADGKFYVKYNHVALPEGYNCQVAQVIIASNMNTFPFVTWAAINTVPEVDRIPVQANWQKQITGMQSKGQIDFIQVHIGIVGNGKSSGRVVLTYRPAGGSSVRYVDAQNDGFEVNYSAFKPFKW